MCGICGELRFDGNYADLAAIALMNNRLARRGPDHSGSYSDGGLGLGHRRLAVVDLSLHANQPMLDQELGLAIVFNGTIYNYPALRAELKARNHHFFSTGDTEVILKAYQEWGPRCVERLRGMFAVAIWDMADKTLFLARDRLGIKPMYWTEDNYRFRFASTLQALLAAGGINTELDPIALHHQFTLHGVVPAPHTILRNIRKLPPAHWLLLYPDGTRHIEKYWHLTATRPTYARSDKEWAEIIHSHLQRAVRMHNAIADVPVGVLLSGGLDSSLLVAMLAEAGVSPLHTFSIGFEDQPEESGNEFKYSDLVATHFATNHHRIQISNTEVLHRLPEAIDAMSEPMFAQDALGFYLLAEQVTKEIKVVQSGQGADEVFGGYFWYPRMNEDSQGTWVERFSRHYFDRDHTEYLQLIAPQYHVPDYTTTLITQLLTEPNADEFLDAVLRLDVTTLIVDDPIKRVDNMTMAHGLEARVPFLDHELVELIASCPPNLKLQSGGKHYLKTIARGLLPDAIIERPKGYFPLPALKYVRKEFLEFMRDILSQEAVKARGLYNQTYLDMLFADPDQHHTKILGSKLWHCAVLEYWLQRQIDNTTH